MKAKAIVKLTIAGLCAGAVTGLLGAGGGMVLVPLLCTLTDLDKDSVFGASVAIILPICLVSLLLGSELTANIWNDAFPYFLGSAAGGIFSGLLGKKIPALWLHRILGAMILWGGIRNLC